MCCDTAVDKDGVDAVGRNTDPVHPRSHLVVESVCSQWHPPCSPELPLLLSNLNGAAIRDLTITYPTRARANSFQSKSQLRLVFSSRCRVTRENWPSLHPSYPVAQLLLCSQFLLWLLKGFAHEVAASQDTSDTRTCRMHGYSTIRECCFEPYSACVTSPLTWVASYDFQFLTPSSPVAPTGCSYQHRFSPRSTSAPTVHNPPSHTC